MKNELTASFVAIVIGISSVILAFFNGIRVLSLPLGIIGVIFSLIFLIKKTKFKLFMFAFLLSIISIPIAYGMTYLTHHVNYSSIQKFQSALDSGKNVIGKTVKFKVRDTQPNSMLGFSINATGNEVAFLTTKSDAKGVKKGDIITVKVESKPAKVFGVYMISGNVEYIDASSKSFPSVKNAKSSQKSEQNTDVSKKEQTYSLHNTSFTAPTTWVKQLTDDSDDSTDTMNFTLGNGYLNVHFTETDDSILDDTYRASFVSDFTNSTSNNISNAKMTNETKGDNSPSYAWYISFIQNEADYNGEIVSLDVEGGIITFTLYTSGNTFTKDYEEDFDNLLASINYTKRTGE